MKIVSSSPLTIWVCLCVTEVHVISPEWSLRTPIIFQFWVQMGPLRIQNVHFLWFWGFLRPFYLCNGHSTSKVLMLSLHMLLCFHICIWLKTIHRLKIVLKRSGPHIWSLRMVAVTPSLHDLQPDLHSLNSLNATTNVNITSYNAVVKCSSENTDLFHLD